MRMGLLLLLGWLQLCCLWAAGGENVRLPTMFLASESGAVAWSGGAEVEFTQTGFALRMGEGPGLGFRFVGARAVRPMVEKPSGFRLTDIRPRREVLSPHSELRYRELYVGIDAVFHARGGRLEYDFEVAAGADPGRIGLALPGNAVAAVEGDGSLVVRAGGKVYRQLAPVAWQEGAGGRVPVAVGFVVAKSVVRFRLGGYDRSLPLVIDPALDYSTYLGSMNGISIATDPVGNLYLALATAGLLTPSKSFGPAGQRPSDVLVAKFDPTGANLLYATLVGGSRGHEVVKMVVNAAGEAYVVGHTSSMDFPQVNPVTVNRFSVSQEGFAFRLSADGQNLLYSTILGGAGNTTTYDAAVDASGNLYVAAGSSNGLLFPATTVYAPGGTTSEMGLCLKIGPNGGAYQYAAAISGPPRSLMTVTGVTVNAAGRALWMVATDSPAIPPAGGGAAKTSSDPQGMVLEWNATGTAPAFLSTLFPNASWRPQRFLFAPDQSLLLLGSTMGTSTLPAGERNIGDGTRPGAFLVNLSADTSRILVRNKLDFFAQEVAVDGGGNLVLGSFAYIGLPVYDAYQTVDRGGGSIYVRKYAPNWEDPIYATYLGGTDEERLRAMVVDPQGGVWLAGTTRSADFPVINSRTRGPLAANGETFGFLARLRDTPGSIVHTITSQPSGMRVWVDGTGYTTPARFAWQPGTQHTITISQYGGAGAQYPNAHYFDDGRWDHGGPLSQTITASATPTAYSFTFTRYECTFAVSPRSFKVGTAGAAVTVNVTTQPQCMWEPKSQVPWMRYMTYRNEGSGPLLMGVDASPNGAARQGTFSVGGVSVVVEQGGVVPRPESFTTLSRGEDPRDRVVVASFFDGDGEQDLGVLNILINHALDARNACYLAFDSTSNTMYLVNDDNTNLTATGLLSSTPIQNGQCSVRSVLVERLGSFLNVTMILRFQAAFQGDKIVFMAARDRGGANSGWSPRGVLWLADTRPENTRPQVVGYSQNQAGRIQVGYRDAVAASNITAVQLLINGELNGANACYVGYDGLANVMYLLDDTGAGLLLPGITPGSPGTVANRQCTLDGATSSRTVSGRDLTLNFGLTLRPSFRGHFLYFGGVQSRSPGATNSGWRYLRYLNLTQ